MSLYEYLSFLSGIGIAVYVWRWGVAGHTISYMFYGHYLHKTKKLYSIRALLEDMLSYDIYAAHATRPVSYHTYSLAVSAHTDEAFEKYRHDMRYALYVIAKRLFWYSMPFLLVFMGSIPLFLCGIIGYSLVRYGKHYVTVIRTKEPVPTLLILVDYMLEMQKTSNK